MEHVSLHERVERLFNAFNIHGIIGSVQRLRVYPTVQGTNERAEIKQKINPYAFAGTICSGKT